MTFMRDGNSLCGFHFYILASTQIRALKCTCARPRIHLFVFHTARDATAASITAAQLVVPDADAAFSSLSAGGNGGGGSDAGRLRADKGTRAERDGPPSPPRRDLFAIRYGDEDADSAADNRRHSQHDQTRRRRAACRGRSLEVFAARAAVGEALAAAGGAEDLAHDARVRRGAEGLLLRDYACASVLCIF